MSEDPPRLLDSDASSELGRALRVARGDVLGNAAIARVRAGIAATASTTASTAGTATVAAVQRSSSFGVLAKMGVLVLVVGAGAGIYYGLTHAGPVDAPAPVTTAAPITPIPPIAPIAPIAPAPAPPEPVRIVDPLQPPRMESAATAVVPSTPPRVMPRASPQPSADAVKREGAVLLEARRVLDTDPAKALALVKKCEADFPDSQLAPERTRIAAQARQRLAQ